jgi:hypothetical protein
MSASILLHAGGPPPDLSPMLRASAPPQDSTPVSLDDRIRELEANLIGWALKVSHGNKSRAAELLQIKRSTLGDRINRCGLGRVAAVGIPEQAATPMIASRHAEGLDTGCSSRIPDSLQPAPGA